MAADQHGAAFVAAVLSEIEVDATVLVSELCHSADLESPSLLSQDEAVSERGERSRLSGKGLRPNVADEHLVCDRQAQQQVQQQVQTASAWGATYLHGWCAV